MRAAALALLAAGCAATVGGAASGAARRDDVAHRVVASNGAQLTAMRDPRVFYGGLWFDDPQCQQQFAAPGVIGRDRLDLFAVCLAGLHLQETERRHPYEDVIELVSSPGFEVEAAFDDGGAITWIGYAGRHDLRDGLPSITPAALEMRRTSGAATPVLDDPARARLRAERKELGVEHSQVWFKLCLDADGKVTGVHPRQESAPVATEVFGAAVAGWTFRPFVVGGHAIPVCAMIHLADPPDDDDRALPYPVPDELGDVVVGTTALHRVSGDTQLQPIDADKQVLSEAHVHRVVASFGLCIDEHGAVTKVVPLRSTRVPRYDRRLAAAVGGWKYRPYVVEGTARAACAGIELIYNPR